MPPACSADPPTWSQSLDLCTRGKHDKYVHIVAQYIHKDDPSPLAWGENSKVQYNTFMGTTNFR